jgi:hypothetical protein
LPWLEEKREPRPPLGDFPLAAKLAPARETSKEDGVGCVVHEPRDGHRFHPGSKAPHE